MKRLLYTLTTLLFIVSILFANPYIVLADEGKDDVHGLDVEVNGYHITLSNPNEWAKGGNTIIVTLADEMGMPVTNADVEILISPMEAGGHSATEADDHAAESDPHAAEPQGHDSMPGMDMGEPTQQASAHDTAAHDEEMADPIAMHEGDEHGMYVAETHLEDSGEHQVTVMFHVNGEMIEANFVVEIPGTSSKIVVLWTFALINTALIASAGFIKKQSLAVKGAD